MEISCSCSCCSSTNICLDFFWKHLPLLWMLCLHYFHGTFCLKLHLRRYRVYVYNDIWYRFSLWLTLLLVLWFILCCFLLASFLYCRYHLPITPMMISVLGFLFSHLNLLSHIFLIKRKPMLYFYADLCLHDQIFCLDELH